MNFKSVLYLDDMRTPLILGIQVVRSHDEFVHFLETHEMPDLISFDHDLSFDHYPVSENRPGDHIPYESYKEKTGLHAARYIVENNLPLKLWMCHSMNVQGRINIETELRKYQPKGELKGVRIPYTVEPLSPVTTKR